MRSNRRLRDVIDPTTLPQTGARAGLVDEDGEYGLFIYPSGVLYCSAGGATASSLTGAIVAGTWQKVACSYDGTAVRLSINDAVVATTPNTAPVTTGQPGGLSIGSNSPSGDDFDGLVDDVRIFSDRAVEFRLSQKWGARPLVQWRTLRETMSNAAKKMQSNTTTNRRAGRLVTADGRMLALRGATLRADAKGGHCARRSRARRSRTSTRSRSPSRTSCRCRPTARCRATRSPSGDKRIVGEVDRRQAARERFEEAIASGWHTALVDQERSALFTAEIGNIPPGATVKAELLYPANVRLHQQDELKE